VSRHQARTKNNKIGQRPSRHGELKGENFQRAPGCFATEMAMARNFARRRNGELKGEDFQKVGSSGQRYFAMASENPARRSKAVSSNPDDVAETHWQRKLISLGEENLARRNVTFSDLYKS